MDPMPQNNDQLLREIYRMTHENNQMMHHMRRTAFFWGFIKIVIYAIILILPIWFYMTYLNGTVNQMLNTMNRIEGNPQSQSQAQGIQGMLQQLQQIESRFGASTSTTK